MKTGNEFGGKTDSSYFTGIKKSLTIISNFKNKQRMKKTMTVFLLAMSICVMAQNAERQKYYFEKRMKEVKSVISLTKVNEQKITSVYNQLCKTQPEEEAEWLFKIAMRRVVNDSAQIIKASEKEITKAVNARLPYNIEYTRISKQLSASQAKTLSALLFDQEKELRILDYLYPDNVEERIKAEIRISNIYGNKLDMAYTRLGARTWLSNFATALKFIKELNLSPSQIDDLWNLGWAISRDTPENKDPGLRGIAEHKGTKQILSKAQYDLFLECRVKVSAQKEVQKSWNEMKKYNMSAEIDSATVSKTLLPFFTERALISERYKNMEGAEEQHQIMLDNLNATKPAILKKLHAIKEREKKKTAIQPNIMTW